MVGLLFAKRPEWVVLLVGLALLVGCLPQPDSGEQPTEKEYQLTHACVCVSAAEAYVQGARGGGGGPPAPPVDFPVRPSSECDNCSRRGWLGDGQPRGDCPMCDRLGNGTNEDPLPSRDVAQPLPEKQPDPEPPRVPLKFPAYFDRHFPTVAEQCTATGKPMFVMVFAEWCRNCPQLVRVLMDDDVKEYITDNFVPLAMDYDEPFGIGAGASLVKDELPLAPPAIGIFTLNEAGDFRPVYYSNPDTPPDNSTFEGTSAALLETLKGVNYAK